MNINSKEYWNNRFNTDWLDYSGDKQTVFFANILCQMLPHNLVMEIRENEYSVCDMGCAMGEGEPIYCRKLSVDVDGMDFSESAIKKALQTYPEYNFWVGDLKNLDKDYRYDVVICSNVLEHFVNPWKIVKNLTNIANKYLILMFPYKEKLNIDEHMYYFSENVIPMKIGSFSLVYEDTVDGSDFQNSLYPDQQILLIYKKDCDNMVFLSELTRGIVESKEREKNKESVVLKNEKKEIELKVNNLEKQVTLKDMQIDNLNKENADKELQINNIHDLENEVQRLNQELLEKENIIVAARSLCLNINAKTSYKLLCVFSRFIKQFILGSLEEKRKFIRICKKCITRESSEFSKNDGYNMLLNIVNVLDSQNNNLSFNRGNGNKLESIMNSKILLNQSNMINPNELASCTKEQLRREYCKADVIIFSVIDYDFRYQRPQHFATRFAKNGHRVFYINANFIKPDYVKEAEQDLYVVNFHNKNCNAIYYVSESSDFGQWFKEKIDDLINLYAIEDAMVVLDYPNWAEGAEYVRKTYGFKITVDYMDDFTGFLGTTTNALKENCIHMLKNSDMVVASSKFLCDIATKYAKNIRVIRNGTEVEHFYKALKLETHKERSVVGYYGAVSHWFAWEKVCYIAKNLPEVDIVIIGEVTEHREKLEKYKNIKLLGEKSYEELPEHLAYFDVCLIPFDTSTDLIKATNPVKFYEYLSAGKRVVATEIPELEPYRDEYVYMSNDDEQFLEYVKLCLSHKDTLKSKSECVAFAKENDWQKRYEMFAEACKEATPKVSIVVLTYNNLELNKYCIRSILEKTAYSNYELIVLDNCSTDGTVEYLKELKRAEDPRVKIIINEKNSGFAGGNNLAIDQSTGEYIMLLNNDTVVTRGWLTNAVKHMSNDPKCGMCGAVTNSIGNEAMIGVNYRNLTELDSFAFQYTRKHNNEVYRKVDRLALFCTLIRKEIMDKHGKLDENYEVGMFEDDDYALVVEKAGYHFYVADDVFVHHVNNASFKKIQSEQYKKIFEKNKAYFEKKWNVTWKTPKYRKGVTAVINEDMMIAPIDK